MMRRIAEWLLDLIAGDRELGVDPRYHPYYPGELNDDDELFLNNARRKDQP